MSPADPHFASRVRESFGRQKAMALIGASLKSVAAGQVEIALPYRDDLTQQKGFIHGGILGMIADTACGYAAFSLMPAGGSLVTVEYKMNILKPGRDERAQLERFLAVLESHKSSLLQQRSDIEAQLSEIQAFEKKVRKQLKRS